MVASGVVEVVGRGKAAAEAHGAVAHDGVARDAGVRDGAARDGDGAEDRGGDEVDLKHKYKLQS